MSQDAGLSAIWLEPAVLAGFAAVLLTGASPALRHRLTVGSMM